MSQPCKAKQAYYKPYNEFPQDLSEAICHCTGCSGNVNQNKPVKVVRATIHAIIPEVSLGKSSGKTEEIKGLGLPKGSKIDETTQTKETRLITAEELLFICNGKRKKGFKEEEECSSKNTRSCNVQTCPHIKGATSASEKRSTQKQPLADSIKDKNKGDPKKSHDGDKVVVQNITYGCECGNFTKALPISSNVSSNQLDECDCCVCSQAIISEDPKSTEKPFMECHCDTKKNKKSCVIM